MMAAMRNDQIVFTCLSCSIAFLSADQQRVHYHSDLHRYNMKRRVASLPPVSAEVFDSKISEKRAESVTRVSTAGLSCKICSKSYTTENAYWSHINSKKHKEKQVRPPSRRRGYTDIHTSLPPTSSVGQGEDLTSASAWDPSALTKEDRNAESDVIGILDHKISASTVRLTPNDCLFCHEESISLQDNLDHMSLSHSFFIPDAEYLVDMPGLIAYLGEKITVGNICIYCNGKGKEFHTLNAVRKHMVDKSHCKIAYDSSQDRLEISDYYDFTNSYTMTTSKAPNDDAGDSSSWEDVDEDDDGNADGVLDDDADGSLPDNQLTYGDSEFELVLPSGARIGHRSLRRYYAQSFSSSFVKSDDPNSGAALVRRLLTDKRSALVSRKGGFGAFGSGVEVIKARNRGEAREAARHVREYRDQRRREEFKTRIAFVHNSQKHYRDPLLQ